YSKRDLAYVEDEKWCQRLNPKLVVAVAATIATVVKQRHLLHKCISRSGSNAQTKPLRSIKRKCLRLYLCLLFTTPHLRRLHRRPFSNSKIQQDFVVVAAVANGCCGSSVSLWWPNLLLIVRCCSAPLFLSGRSCCIGKGLIPADMVANSIIIALLVHSKSNSSNNLIYHIGTSNNFSCIAYMVMVFVVAALSLIPLVPGHLSNRAYRLSFLDCNYNSTVAVSWTLGVGGGVVLLYASKYDDVKLVVNISRCYDLKTGVEERLGKDYMERIKKDGFIDVKYRSVSFNYRVAEESLMDCLGTNMHEACLNIDKDCRSEKNLVFSLLLHPSATYCTFFYCLSFVTSHFILKL
ncbi:hypothetical protein S83_012319, partial [Arachis hypogaea]